MKRGDATGDDALHKIRRCAECRRNLARIEHTNSTAAAGADVKQAPAFPERSRHDLDRLGKIDNRPAQRILHKSLFLDKKLDQFTRAHFFQIFRARVALLG